ncbi:MAG: hypothetical protein PHF56_21530 [Desulfuromonadaceae bacterium]|nr:hypothetical protein [Desulfuromonadaceae bacterium]
MNKWGLAPNEGSRLGGKLAHNIVMQQVGLDTLDLYIADIKKDLADIMAVKIPNK